MKRILIVGRPGSGKTTLAKQLGKLYDIYVISLDSLYFDVSKPYHSNPHEWQRKLTELAADDEWIIEGVHVLDMAEQAGRAEQIIFLDRPAYLSAARIVKRSVRTLSRVPAEVPRGYKQIELPSAPVWWWKIVLNFNKTFSDKLEKLLRDKSKVVIIKDRRQALKLLSK